MEHDNKDISNSLPERSVRDEGQPLVQISEVARLSAICALAGPACLLGLLVFGWADAFAVLAMLAVPILAAIAFILGIVGLASIAFSGGRRTGYAYAMVGIGLPLTGALFLFLSVTPKIRVLDDRMECGTNLSGIGKAMLIYANENDDVFPRAGDKSSVWAVRTPSWTADSRQDAYGLGDPNAEGGQVSISSSLYLLVKYAEVAPKLFVCRGDEGTTAFDPKAYGVDANMVDLWDFGPNPPKHCSYAYQMIYSPSELTTSADPGFAILADRSPWMAPPSRKAVDFSEFMPDLGTYGGTSQQAKNGNTLAHKRQGENVLFADTHVDWEKRPYCSLEDDNIYTSWDNGDKSRGVPPKLGSVPADPRDSLLVNDPVLPSK